MIWQLKFFFSVLRFTFYRPASARVLWRSWYWMARCQWKGVCYLDVSSSLVYR